MYGTKCINIEQKIPVKIANHNVAAEIDEFVECIDKKTMPKINLGWHKDTIKAMNAVYESIATGKAVKL